MDDAIASTTSSTAQDSNNGNAAPEPKTGAKTGAASQTPVDSIGLRRRLNTISAVDHLYLRLPSGAIRALRPRELDPTSSASARGPGSRKHKVALKNLRTSNVVALGKFGNLDLNDLNGVPYGFTWEIVPLKDKRAAAASDPEAEETTLDANVAAGERSSRASLQKAKGKRKARKAVEVLGSVRIMMGQTLPELEETNATNEDIYDDPQARSRLAMIDIQALKEAGLDGQDLINYVLKQSASFEKRTVFSQEKYVKKKEAKHLRLFTPMPPTLPTIIDYYFENKNSDKIGGLRIDALSQLLSAGNVAPGGRYIVIDGTSGLLVAACLEKMGGEGTLLAIHDAESPPEYEVPKTLNLPPKTVETVLRFLHWGQVASNYRAPRLPEIPSLPNAEDPAVPVRSTAEGAKLWRNRDRERHRLLKRHQAAADLEAVRQDLFAGEWDGLLVASPYEPVSIIETLCPYLAGSAAISVHSPYLQPLIEAHARLRGNPEVINLAVTEPWMRRYQVLPGRTHPEMSTSATSGYLLSATRVYTQAYAAEMAQKERTRRIAELESQAQEAQSDTMVGSDTTLTILSNDARGTGTRKRAAVDLDTPDLDGVSKVAALGENILSVQIPSAMVLGTRGEACKKTKLE